MSLHRLIGNSRRKSPIVFHNKSKEGKDSLWNGNYAGVVHVRLPRSRQLQQLRELFGRETGVVQNAAEGTELDCFASVDGDGYSSGALGMDKDVTSSLAVEDKSPTFQSADNLITGDPWKLYAAASTC